MIKLRGAFFGRLKACAYERNDSEERIITVVSATHGSVLSNMTVLACIASESQAWS